MPDFVPDHPQNTIVTDPEAGNAVQTPDSDLVDATSLTSPLEGKSPSEIRAADPGAYGSQAAATLADDVQSLAVDGEGGTFDLTVVNPLTEVSADLADIAYDVTAEDLQAALDELTNVNPGDIVVTGGPGDKGATKPYVLTAGGSWAGVAVTTYVADDANITGGTVGEVVVTHDVTGGT
jgi:hypothetical protein